METRLMESRDPITDIDYSNTYHKGFLEGSDGFENLKNRHIKFGDALAAICYAYDIDYDTMLERFPQVKKNERYHGDKYSVQDQMDFVKQHAKRTPKNVLEIGRTESDLRKAIEILSKSVISQSKSVIAKTDDFFTI